MHNTSRLLEGERKKERDPLPARFSNALPLNRQLQHRPDEEVKAAPETAAESPIRPLPNPALCGTSSIDASSCSPTLLPASRRHFLPRLLPSSSSVPDCRRPRWTVFLPASANLPECIPPKWTTYLETDQHCGHHGAVSTTWFYNVQSVIGSRRRTPPPRLFICLLRTWSGAPALECPFVHLRSKWIGSTWSVLFPEDSTERHSTGQCQLNENVDGTWQ